MNIAYKDELSSIIPSSDMFGSKSHIYTCIFNNNIFIYKEIPNLDEDTINTLEVISTIKNKNLVLPEFLVYDKNKFSGYIIQYLNNYLPLFSLDDLDLDKKIKILKITKKIILDMHKENIIHMDLNPFNILCKKSKIKIIDFDDSIYKFNRNSNNLNPLVLEYLNKNKIDFGVDIFIFNITTLSNIFNIPFYDVLKYPIEEKLNNEKLEIFEKTKKLQKLTDNDYLIDYYK